MGKRVIAVCLLACLAGAGCVVLPQPWGTRTGRWGPAEEIVTAALENAGGRRRLEDIRAIRANAIISWYDDLGAANVSAQRLVIRPNEGEIVSFGGRPDGQWRAVVRLDGRSSFTTAGMIELTEEDRRIITGYLQVILHRVRGVMNLLDDAESVIWAEDVLTLGQELVRVEVAGRPDLARAYFFRRDSGELALVTTGVPAPPGPGTATIYRNRRLADGLLLPEALRITEVGEFALIGRRVLLNVELHDLAVE